MMLFIFHFHTTYFLNKTSQNISKLLKNTINELLKQNIVKLAKRQQETWSMFSAYTANDGVEGLWRYVSVCRACWLMKAFSNKERLYKYNPIM